MCNLNPIETGFLNDRYAVSIRSCIRKAVFNVIIKDYWYAKD